MGFYRLDVVYANNKVHIEVFLIKLVFISAGVAVW